MRFPLIAQLAGLAAVNALLPAAMTSITEQSLTDALISGLGHSFVIWFSLGVSVLLWRKSDGKLQQYNMHSYCLCLLLSLTLLIPLATLNWLVCACCASQWLHQYRSDRYSRAAAMLLLATAVREPATQLLLTLFADQILSFDTWLTYLSLSLNSTNFSIQNNLISQADGYSLLILTGCSAFGNLSLALLLWLALSLLYRQDLSLPDLAAATFVMFTVLALNTSRLALMATGQNWYQRLHQGDGAMLFELAILLTPLLTVFWRNRYETYRSGTTYSGAGTAAGAGNKNSKTSAARV